MRAIMSYWLFQTMYDWYPKAWGSMVEGGFIATNWPMEWERDVSYKRNIRRIKLIQKGDWVVAAFGKHRFAGYGRLTSNFYRATRSLKITHADDPKHILAFRERFNIRWVTIPLERNPPCVQCNELKNKKFDIDLARGHTVKRIDKRTFYAIKKCLDLGGAKRITSIISSEDSSQGGHETARRIEDQATIEGARYRSEVEFCSRNHRLIETKKAESDYRCEICGMSFENLYGDIGKEVIIAHHKIPIGTRRRATATSLSDIALVCANCHLMIHKKEPPYRSIEIKNKIRKAAKAQG